MMTALTKTAADVFAPTDGAGNLRGPSNGDAQLWGTEIERSIETLEHGFDVDYGTRALLFADLNWGAGSIGRVFGDSTAANNGVYKKAGASGAGSWSKIGDLPGTVANNGVDNAKLSDMAQGTIKGRIVNAGTGDPVDLTAAQVRSIIKVNDPATNIASATAIDIGAADGDLIGITGSEAISSLGSAEGGIERTLRFLTGGARLVHNGLVISLPGEADIVTAINDTAVFRSLGSGTWVCVSYKKQSGESIAEAATVGQEMLAARPGDARRRHTESLTDDAPVDTDPLASSKTTTDDDGAVALLTGEAVVATRAVFAVEPARKYRLRYVVRRKVNTPDPANDSVRCGVAWYDRNKARLAGGDAQTVIEEITDLTTASGRVQVVETASRSASVGADHVAPSGARYARLYVETFGTTHQTHVEVIDWMDVTDLADFAPDVTALDGRVTALEGLTIGSRLNALESAVGTPSKLTFATIADAEAATIAGTVDELEALNSATVGDAAGGRYMRVVSEPSHDEKLQSADGAWWEKQRISSLNYIRGDHALTPYDADSNPVSPYDPLDADVRVAVQEIIDTAKADFYSPHSIFRTRVSLAGRGWTIGDGSGTTGLDIADIRNPGFQFGGGTIHAKMAGGNAVDSVGTNSPDYSGLHIYMDPTYPPDVGFLYAKSDPDGGSPNWPDSKQMEANKVRVRGVARKAAGVIFSNEVGDWLQCKWVNNSRDPKAVSLVMCSHRNTLDRYLGTANGFAANIDSAFAAMPDIAAGSQSNILHAMYQLEALRQADVTLTLTGVTKGAQTILQFSSPAAVAAAGFVAGDMLFTRLNNGHPTFLIGLGGTNQEILSVDGVAGTITIDLDSSAFTVAGTESGFCHNQTGAAMIVDGVGGLMAFSAYILAYGSPGIIANMRDTPVMRAWQMRYQPETDQPQAIRFDVDGVDAVIQGFDQQVMSINQHFKHEVFNINGTGSLAIDGFDLSIPNMGNPALPANGIFNDPTKVHIRGARWRLANSAAFQSPYTNAYKTVGNRPGFSGTVEMMDNSGGEKRFGGQHEKVAFSAVAGSAHTGTTAETILRTINMPAYYPGANGRVKVRAVFSCSAHATNTKTGRVRINGVAGSVCSSVTSSASAVTMVLEAIIDTRNAHGSQLTGPASFIGVGSSTSALATPSQNFTVPWTIDITGAMTDVGESITLQSYSVEVFRP